MGRECGPEDLDGAPQVEHKEHHRLALHLLQTTEDDKENNVSARHLLIGRKEALEMNTTIFTFQNTIIFLSNMMSVCSSWH